MSEEEKKAIETIKGLTVYYDDYSLLDEEEIEENDNINKSIQLIIDLTERQQKEIEHWKAGMEIVQKDKNNHIERLEKELNNLKEIEKSHQEENGKLRVELEQEKEKNTELRIQISAREQVCEDLQKQLNGAFDRGFISKDKIKEKIEEYENAKGIRDWDKINAWKELLESDKQ